MIIGNPHVITFFNRSLQAGELSHTYLFVGPRDVGKTHSTKQIARALETKHSLPFVEFIAQREDCTCDSCSAIARSTHPDVFVFLDAITIKDARMLKGQLAQTPLASPFHIIIIKNIHNATPEAAQALLKVLEEPNDSTIFFLTAENLSSVLPTIISRSTIVHFSFASQKAIADFFSSGISQARKKVYEELAPYWQGRPARLMRLRDETYVKRIADTKKTAERFLHAPLAERFFIAQWYASLERIEVISILEEWMLWWKAAQAFRALRPLYRLHQSLQHTPVNIQTSMEYLALAIKEKTL